MQCATRSIASVFALALSLALTHAGFAQRQITGKTVKTGTWNGQEIEYLAGQIAAKLKPSAAKAQLVPLLPQYNAALTRDFDELGWGMVELPEGEDIFPVITALKNSPVVAVAEPNGVMRIALEPNDPISEVPVPLHIRTSGA